MNAFRSAERINRRVPPDGFLPHLAEASKSIVCTASINERRRPMNTLSRSLVVGVIAFGASLLGMAAQSLIPAADLAATKPAVGAIAGLFALLLALVLGLLIWTAFAVYTGQQSEAFSLGPLIAQLDLLLEQSGPEAAGGRAGLRAALQRSRKQFFENAKSGPQLLTIQEIKETLAGLSGYFDSVASVDEAHQRRLQTARDLALKFHDTETAMLIRLVSPFPPHVIEIVVVWAAILFFGDGLSATPNIVSISAHFVGAFGVATAIYLILELSSPYTGFIKLSPAGLDRVIEGLGHSGV